MHGKKKTLTVVFKQNNQQQARLLPPDLNDLVAANHPVRMVDAILEKIDIIPLIRLHKPEGTSQLSSKNVVKSAGICLYQ